MMSRAPTRSPAPDLVGKAPWAASRSRDRIRCPRWSRASQKRLERPPLKACHPPSGRPPRDAAPITNHRPCCRDPTAGGRRRREHQPRYAGVPTSFDLSQPVLHSVYSDRAVRGSRASERSSGERAVRAKAAGCVRASPTVHERPRPVTDPYGCVGQGPAAAFTTARPSRPRRKAGRWGRRPGAVRAGLRQPPLRLGPRRPRRPGG
jgi:hypothetical protein